MMSIFEGDYITFPLAHMIKIRHLRSLTTCTGTSIHEVLVYLLLTIPALQGIV
jgi:hypothetical protein